MNLVTQFLESCKTMTETAAKLLVTRVTQPQPYIKAESGRVIVFFANRLNASIEGVKCQIGYEFSFPVTPNANTLRFSKIHYYEDGELVDDYDYTQDFPQILIDDYKDFAHYWVQLEFDKKVAALSFEQTYATEGYRLKKFAYNPKNDTFIFSYYDLDSLLHVMVIKRSEWFELIRTRLSESEEKNFYSWHGGNLTIHLNLLAVARLIQMPGYRGDKYIFFPTMQNNAEMPDNGSALDYWRAVNKEKRHFVVTKYQPPAPVATRRKNLVRGFA